VPHPKSLRKPAFEAYFVKGTTEHRALAVLDQALFDIGVNNLRSRRAIEKLGGHLTAESSIDTSRAIYEINKTGQWNVPFSPI
jgi:hypothetical protein